VLSKGALSESIVASEWQAIQAFVFVELTLSPIVDFDAESVSLSSY
jgi:hypothetical protein